MCFIRTSGGLRLCQLLTLQSFIHNFRSYRLSSALILYYIEGPLALSPQEQRTFSPAVWLPWLCHHIWSLFRQTRREGCLRQTPCSSFPIRLRERTPAKEKTATVSGQLKITLTFFQIYRSLYRKNQGLSDNPNILLLNSK